MHIKQRHKHKEKIAKFCYSYVYVYAYMLRRSEDSREFTNVRRRRQDDA